jgi:hypothetical protein
MQPGMTRGWGACVDVGDEDPVCAARAVRRIESIRGAVDRVENAENSLTSKRMWLALDAWMGGPVRAPSQPSGSGSCRGRSRCACAEPLQQGWALALATASISALPEVWQRAQARMRVRGELGELGEL